MLLIESLDVLGSYLRARGKIQVQRNQGFCPGHKVRVRIGIVLAALRKQKTKTKKTKQARKIP